MTVHAIGCENGTINWDVSGGVKQKNVDKYAGYVSLEKIKNDVTVVAKCTLKGATSSCKEVSLTSKFPYVDCNEVYLVWKSSLIKQGYVDVYGMKGNVEFKLIDEQGKEYSSFFDDAQQKNIVQLPVLDGKRIYHAVFPGKSCTYDILIEAYKLQILASTSTETTQSTVNPITLKISEYSNSSRTVKCNGRIVWTNDKDGNSIEAAELVLSYTPTSDNSLPFPTVTTTYYAACHITNEDGSTSIYPVINSKLMVVNSDYCFRIESDKNKVNKGDKINLTAIGCTEAIWSQGGIEFGFGRSPMPTTPIPPSGNTITYKATCPELSGCSETITIQVLPCNFKITPSKTFAKIAERVSLTASGCSGGEVQWSTGETGDSITVRPLEKMTYTANCMVEGASVCENSVTITVDNLPPDDIECPQLTLTATPGTFEGCTNQLVTVKPSGCQASATISWDDGMVTQGNESRSFQLNKTTTIRGTCISIYDTPAHPLQSTAELEVTAQLTTSLSVVSPVRVYPGYATTISAFGCYTADCNDGNYRWENKTISAPILYGASVNVKVTRETIYEVSCNGLKKTVKIEMKESQNCDRNVQNTTTVNGYSKLVVNDKCDSDYSITWFDLTSNTVVATNARSIKVKQTNEILPYLVICSTSEGIPCSEVLFTSKQPNVTTGGNVIKEEVSTPDPCKDLEINAVKTMNSPSSILYLQSGFCPGIVQWFSDESKSASSYLATIRDGERYTVGKITSPKTYYYTCSVSGAQCEGSAIANPATSSARESAAAATTSTIVEQQCSSTISLAKTMEEFYLLLLCQDVNLYEGDRAKAQNYLGILDLTLQSNAISSSIKFPTNTDAIVDEMVNGNCKVAGKLLASANGGQTVPIGDVKVVIANYNRLHNSIIEALKIPFSIHLQAFAPFDTFGFGFEGDGEDRRIGNNRQRYRLYSAMSLQYQGSNFVAISKIKTIPANSSWFGNNSQPSETISVVDLNNSSIPSKANLQILAFAGNDATMQKDINNYLERNYNTDIGILTNMNIDRHLTLSMEMKQFAKNIQILKLNGTLDGEFFPATDLYITDRNNNSITLGGAAAKIDMKIGVCSICNCEAKNCAPFSHLGKYPYNNFDISLSIKIENGVFTKVIDSFGVEWKILDWNNTWVEKSTVIILPK